MKVYPCGTKITTAIGNIDGLITGIKIEFKSVIYLVQYFTNDCFKTWEMNEEEFTVDDGTKKKTIGFK